MPSVSKSPEYLVKFDTREQTPWTFLAKSPCLGCERVTLKTGDYTLAGYESVFVIERKRSTAELATNLVQDRFWRELERLDSFELPFLVCEFTLADVVNFPVGSGIPESKWGSLRMTPQFLMKLLNDLQVKHKTRLILAGPYGREFCSSLFKRITEHVPQEK